MRTRSGLAALLVSAVLSFGCGGEEAEAPPAGEPGNVKAPPGTFLAYETTADIEVAVDAIAGRLTAAQAACLAQKFGDCAVLGVEQNGGEYPSASLTVRIAPDGAEPLIALAGEGGEIASRTTRAQDLAQAVADNGAKRARLERQLPRFEAFAGRKDLAVADLIALTEQIAETEAQLEAAASEASQQRRRIDTHLVTIHWQPPGGDVATSAISAALRDSGETFARGAAAVIYVVAYLAPIAAAFAPPIALLRWWRRRKRAS